MKHRINVKLACAVGIVLAVQGMLPSVCALAEGFIREERMDSEYLATLSDAEATPSVLKAPMIPHSSSTGDLWEDWNGDMGFSGEGTKESPYRIGNLAELMGLSELTAAGESFAGEYFELTQDIDLGGLEIHDGNWNPIGWYQNVSDLSGDVTHSFQGHFDGNGNTISGLKIIDRSRKLKNVGLFGVIDGGSVRNLIVEGEDIYGHENVAVLAGAIRGGAVIEQVTVSGYVRSDEDAGGIAGEVTGGTDLVTIENCTADGIAVYSGGAGGFVGGIAGNVQKACLVDNVTLTRDGDADRIYGKGYIGGIAGRMNLVQIYNAYVNGTIGGNGSKAVGGIVGKYESGNLVLARMAGDISNTNNGTVSREGTFVGTREGRNGFTYGTEKNSNFSYLYTDSAAKAKCVSGSTIDGDNTFTKEAHIGYWVDNEKKYITVAGRTETACGNRYFYEELEDAVRHIVTGKLERDFTSDGYYEDLPFKIDHFAPGYMGEPVRGYLVSVPRIDARNANGTYDTDVAALTAIPATSNSYYRVIDKEHAAAIAPGAAVSVLTAPRNNGTDRYQMVVNENEEGNVNPPTYTDEDWNQVPMNYVAGGSYSFIMPECDTELNAEYIKVTTRLTVTPEETGINITQTRSGDRKNPSIVTEVRDEEGILIARYIDGAQDPEVQVQSIRIHADSNNGGQTADRAVKWSVDDIDLLQNLSDTGYTLKDAEIRPDMNASFITDIIRREEKVQADNGYREKIGNTIYTRNAVVTAATNPLTSADNKVVYGNCKVRVNFQILDHTTLRVEGLQLNEADIVYTVTRTLTGDRLNPEETISCSEPVILTATLRPERPFYQNVGWSDRESGKIVTLMPQGDHTQDCAVQVRFDESGKANPAWIQNVIHADHEKRKADPYAKLSGSASYHETVTATSEDQTNGNQTASCSVNIRFVTVDETVIHPDGVAMSRDNVSFHLSQTKKGDSNSETIRCDGFEAVDLDCTVLPDLTGEDVHMPYDRSVTWSVSDSDVLSVDQNGVIVPNQNAQWIRDALAAAPYQAEQTVFVYATTNDNKRIGTTKVELHYEAHLVEQEKDMEIINLTLNMTGRRSSPTLTWGGTQARNLGAKTYPGNRTVKYKSSDADILTVSEDGMVTPVLDTEHEWVKKAMSYPYVNQVLAVIEATDGTSTDVCQVRVNLTVADRTYSGSSGGSGGGSGGSSGGGKPTVGGPGTVGIPSYVVNGTWHRDEAGRWSFTDGARTYADEWAAVHNPYANTAAGQNVFDWFRFDREGFMVWGWYTDMDGTVYYLNPVSDGTLGRMYTGWNWIDGKCYYFNEKSDGTRGALKKNFVTEDGYQTDQSGAWVVNGVVQTQ